MGSCPDDETIRGNKRGDSAPTGVDVPMCFCGDRCKVVSSAMMGDFYGMRWFMCPNYAYDPPKVFSNERPKVVTKPPFCFRYVS